MSCYRFIFQQINPIITTKITPIQIIIPMDITMDIDTDLNFVFIIFNEHLGCF